MSCTVEKRHQAHDVRDQFDDCASVIDATALAPGENETGRWAVEVLVEYQGVPADVLLTAGLAGLIQHDSTRKGAYWSTLFVV